ncbi:hypothetical protein F4558_002943 [Micromonospora profundi]|nr:hypothetical protein [Micromonospora profundi]
MTFLDPTSGRAWPDSEPLTRAEHTSPIVHPPTHLAVSRNHVVDSQRSRQEKLFTVRKP